MEVQQSRAYYLGLDCGTDSVGYAAADTDYALLRCGGEPVIGVTTFDGAVTAQEPARLPRDAAPPAAAQAARAAGAGALRPRHRRG